MNKSQKGFSVVEVVMGVVVVGLLGALGWVYWTNVANKPKDETKSSETNSTVVKSSPTPVAKKTYNSESLRLAFDYPADWTLTDKTKVKGSTNTSEWDKVEVKSSDGFVVTLTSIPSGIGWAGPNTPRDIKDFRVVSESRFSGVYVVTYTITNEGKSSHVIQLSKYNTEKQTIDDTYNVGTIIYQALPEVNRDKANPGDVVAISFIGTNEGSDNKPTASVAAAAEDILKSLRKL